MNKAKIEKKKKKQHFSNIPTHQSNTYVVCLLKGIKVCAFLHVNKKKKIGDLNDKSENQYCLSVIFPLKRKNENLGAKHAEQRCGVSKHC